MRLCGRKISVISALIIMLIPLVLGGVTTSVAWGQLDATIFVIDPTFPPFAEQNEDGTLDGFDIDIINALAAEANLQIRVETSQFRYLLTGVAARLYDIGGGCIYTNPERAKIINFSQPYFTTGDILIVQGTNKTIAQISDLTTEQTVGVLQGSLSEQYARDHLTSTLISLTSLNDALTQLDAGELNAVLADEESLFGFQQEQPGAKLKAVGDLLTYQECSFVVEKQNTELLAKLNAALAKIKSDGRYEQIYRKWFGERPIRAAPVDPPAPVTNTQAPGQAGAAALTIVDTQTLTTADFVGIYYLSIPDNGALTTTAQPNRYQIVTVAANGLWFASQLYAEGSNGPAPAGADATGTEPQAFEIIAQPGLPGLWWVNEQQQIEATQLLFRTAGSTSAASGNGPEVLRQNYQMTLTADQQVTGSYTTATYATAALAQSATATPTITETVSFTGWRIQ